MQLLSGEEERCFENLEHNPEVYHQNTEDWNTAMKNMLSSLTLGRWEPKAFSFL